MVEIRTVAESDLGRVTRLHNASVDSDESVETVQGWYRENPSLVLGAYDADTLVGYCLGVARSRAEVELIGISVDRPYRREGVGSSLLTTLEDHAAVLGVERISLGSAGADVDEFYLANGYSPDSVLIRLGPNAEPEIDPDADFEITDRRVDDGTKKLYIDVDGYDPTRIEEIREAFGVQEGIYIMVKSIVTA